MDKSVTVCASQQKLRKTMGQTSVVPNAKASPAGGARIIMMVSSHLMKYGPRGVPKGLVEAQNRGHGSTPCLLTVLLD